jgi:hypothetical protein
MTKLIVTPIDLSAPGSFKARRDFMNLARQLEELKKSEQEGKWQAILATYDSLESFLLPRLRTDDDVSVEDVLSQISADEFDELIGKVSFGDEAVPPESASSSPSPSEEEVETSPDG